MSRTPPLPPGFGIELDRWTKQLTPELMFGGSPVRVARLTPAGQAAWRELKPGRVTSAATGALARYLTDTGLAHPVPPAPPVAPVVTVIVPVRDRADLLGRCLAGLGTDHRVVVVDDASSEPDAIARVAASHGARLIRREINGGPAAARNTGLAQTSGDLVAFVDSDCEPSPVSSRTVSASTVSASTVSANTGSAAPGSESAGCTEWITRLSWHFADPLVAVAAPRISGRAGPTAAGRYTEANGALDLGGRPGRVMPRSAISYVPTAALLVRREALLEVARDGQAFDESMRVGEDVDLIWRLHEAGWRIRYDPSVQVPHHEPGSWAELLARRYRYGTSAAPLARRHPGAVVHLALQPWPAATVVALLARRPLTAAAAFGGGLATTAHWLRQADVPTAGLTRATVTATRQTWLGVGRYSTQFAAPLLAAGIAARGRNAVSRLTRRAAVASLLLGPPLTAWAEGPKTLDPARFTLGRIADDIAYGLGVWSGCVTARTLAPLVPIIAWRHLRIDKAATGSRAGYPDRARARATSFAARPATHEEEPP